MDMLKALYLVSICYVLGISLSFFITNRKNKKNLLLTLAISFMYVIIAIVPGLNILVMIFHIVFSIVKYFNDIKDEDELREIYKLNNWKSETSLDKPNYMLKDYET